MKEFDYFIVIDWSARNRPSPVRPSRNAIWLAEGSATNDRKSVRYFRTRHDCIDYLAAKLLRLRARRKRVFVGWDFSFGYPKGTAKCLRLKKKPPWKAIWEFINEMIVDGPDNRNNRFTVGARLNQRINAPGGPFWGVPVGESGIYLGPKKDFSYPVPTKYGMLAERRLVETLHPKMQPAWKLAYAGSVGSQSLLGIPWVYHLRFVREGLKDFSFVWPFEDISDAGPAIVHGEIYPSLLSRRWTDKIPDRQQVRHYLGWLQDLQQKGNLVKNLLAPWGNAAKDSRRVRRHEGWVLGVLRD